VVYVTVSTGVNGVRIVDGRIDRSSFGFEIGGQYLGMGEHAVTLEALVSGRAVSEKYGTHPRDLGADSPVWDELAGHLAYGLNNTILHWSPDRVVLGGSMFNDIGISVDRVRSHLEAVIMKIDTVPEIVHCSLGDFGGLYGGLALLRNVRQ
jgi:predicted NBD/HSP70 family sugar kinase